MESPKLTNEIMYDWGFIPVGCGSFLHPEFRIGAWKPYWDASRFKLEFEGGEVSVQTVEDLRKAIAAAQNKWQGAEKLKDYRKYNR